ncbi:surface protease GP63 [Trypanosoma conorhini]|uniref:Leishmanolysin-like peptidase n=1 Tax=Trypanosoma conorhini TaxID=83891 RepID=A0A422NZ79_9TRYP|nr:surface protease GP63 [Trypanosoma conorhini]RNF10731.1 surface protease GP63 [Trypanosoma conorhini]
MRRPTHAALPPLPLLLLLATTCCVGGCLAAAHRRALDEAALRSGPPPTAMVREVPRKGEGAAQAYTVAAEGEDKGWEPIRIVVSMEDLSDASKYCTKEGEKKPDFRGQELPCAKKEVLTADWNKTLVNEVIPVALKLHAERLLVRRLKTPLKVPKFTEKHGLCQHFKVPEGHQSAGVENADMVLYVAARSNYGEWGLPCAFGTDGRPIAGALNLLPSPQLSVMHSARVAAHAIAYALGFDAKQMKDHKMLTTVSAVRGGSSPVTVVSSPVTLNKTKAHYGCDKLQGMELQDCDGAKDCHLSLRNAKDELMSGLGGITAGYYTALTMAMFEDLGYYKAVWGMEEPMAWGRGAGCDFLEKPCSDKSPAEHPGMFCDKKTEKSFRCTSNRQAIGQCGQNVAEGGANPKETCSVFFPSDDGVPEVFCTVEGSNAPPGSLHGGGSWCLDAEPLEARSKATDKDYTEVHAVCAGVQCEAGKVKVKYLGSDAWQECPEGKFITPKSAHFKDGGKIKCPKYEEVCTIAANGSSLVKLSSPDKDGKKDDKDGKKDDKDGKKDGKDGKKDGQEGSAAVLSSLLVLATVTAAAAVVPL